MKNSKNGPSKIYRYDPVCRIRINNKHKAYHVFHYRNEQFLLCCPECQAQFDANRKRYMEKARKFDAKTNKQRA